MKASMVLSLIGYLVVPSGAAVLGRCVVAKKLHEGGLSDFEGYSLENWVCLAYFESKFNPTAAYDSLRGGYTGYGLFQIRNSDWCDHGKNRCHVSCSAMETHVQVGRGGGREEPDGTSWTLNCQHSDTLERWLDGCKL
ncbi:hypothetical protein J1605_008598 [Eschrichtius robustus]|uniref:Lysozyme-like protein 4 n=1 Tax=Eschrichtius robustus TaxID=9764 RepID=A0AB34GVF7_ESCRO|nr:hypothetical protein J1605_008598 [Eschrichtius robustus]